MSLTLRTLSNHGEPLFDQSGNVLANTEITFTLIDAFGEPSDVFDVITKQRIASVPKKVTTNSNGEFSVDLFPTSRADARSYYSCSVNHPGIKDIFAPVVEGEGVLSWATFKASAGTIEANETSAFTKHVADDSRHLTSAQNAAIDNSTNPSANNPFATITDIMVAGGGHTIKDDGETITQQPIINFVGNGVDVTSDSESGAIVVAINGTETGDAAVGTKGIVKLSVAPADPTNPIAVGTNDSRLSDSRTPLSHNQPLSSISDVNITAVNLNALDDGQSTNLHFHNSDRDRGNHTGTQAWSTVNKTGSKLTDIADIPTPVAGKTIRRKADDTGYEWIDVSSGGSSDHEALSNLQGGAAGDHYHLTNAQLTDLTDNGDSSAHYHSTDRNRSNHTGTQLASTISDFQTSVNNNTNVLASTAHKNDTSVHVTSSDKSVLPTTGEKAALAGTGVPSVTNKFVTQDTLANGLSSKVDTSAIGTSASKDVAISGNASVSQVVMGNDTRLSDARTPLGHNHDATTINTGTIDGDRLPAVSAGKKGAVPATGTPSGKYLKDDGTWASVVSSVNGNSGDVILSATDVGAATSAQGSKVDKTTADEVFATDYNGGALTSATINAAIASIGSSTKTLVLTPGDWTMSSDITIPSNITLRVQPRAVITRVGGTLNIYGPLAAPNSKWLVSFASGMWASYFRMTTTQDVRSIWFDFSGNGTSDDCLPLTAFLQAGNRGKRILEPLTYRINNPTGTVDSNFELYASGATILSEMVEQPLLFGVQKSYYSGLSISVTKNVNHFTIPGGVTLLVGDLVNLKRSTPYTSNYCYGVLTSVVAISGGEAYIDIVPEVTFTADIMRTYYPSDNIKISGLKIDNSATNVSTHGISVIGRNIQINGMELMGAPNAGIGLTFTAIGGQIYNLRAKDYQNRAGSPSGAHYGDGAVLYGHNILVTGATITNCKHDISMSTPEFFSSNIKIADSTFTQSAADFGQIVTGTFGTDSKIHGAIDTHPSLNGLTIDNCTIASAGMVGAVYVRSGNARITNCKITWLNTTNVAGGIIGINEVQLSDLHLSDNTIVAGVADSPLVYDYGGTVGIAAGGVKHSNNTLINVAWGGLRNPISSAISDSAYDNTWVGDTNHAPSKNAVSSKLEAIVATIPAAYTLPDATPSVKGGVTVSGSSTKTASVSGTLTPNKQATFNSNGDLIASTYDVGATSGGSSVTLQTNGSNNTSQSLLNLKQGSNVTLTPDGAGGVTIDAGASYPAAGVPTSTGSAWGSSYNVGTSANNLVQLDSAGKLPAINGSLLTNLPNQMSQATPTLQSTSTSAQNGITLAVSSHDFAVAQAYNSVHFGPNNNTTNPIAGSSWRGFNIVPSYNGVGTLPELNGVFINPKNTSTGAVTSLTGLAVWPRNTNAAGTVNLMKGIYLKSPTNAGTVYTVYGTHIENQGLPGVGSSYGILIEDQTTSTNPYAIYTGAGKIRFGDQVQISNDTPRLWQFDSGAPRSTSNPEWSIRPVHTDGKLHIETSSDGSTWADAVVINSKGNIAVKTVSETSQTLTAVSNVFTPDLSQGSTFPITLGASNTIANPINSPASGLVSSVTLIIKQDGTGSRTVTWGSNYKWGELGAPTLTTAADKTDIVTCFTVDGGTTWMCFLSGRGF